MRGTCQYRSGTTTCTKPIVGRFTSDLGHYNLCQEHKDHFIAVLTKNGLKPLTSR